MSITAKNLIIGGEVPKQKEVEAPRQISIFEKLRKINEPAPVVPEKIKPIPESMIVREVPSKEVKDNNDDYHIVQDGVLEKKYSKKSSYLLDMVDLK
jgi:hypothetical protein